MTYAWWLHQMETFSALLAICAGNSPVTCEFSAQKPVTRDFDVFFDLHLNKRLSKQSWGWWFDAQSRPLWRHCNGLQLYFLTFHSIIYDQWTFHRRRWWIYIYIYIYIFIFNAILYQLSTIQTLSIHFKTFNHNDVTWELSRLQSPASTTIIKTPHYWPPFCDRIPLVNGHYNDVIMTAMSSQITSLKIVYSILYSRRISKTTSKLRVTGLCAGKSPVTGEFPAQRATNVENVFI